MTKSVILSNRRFILTLVIGTLDAPPSLAQTVTLELQSTRNGPDLRHKDDVVVVVNGTPIPVETFDAHHASAPFPHPWEHYQRAGLHVMVRIGEFFDGWHLDTSSPQAAS